MPLPSVQGFSSQLSRSIVLLSLISKRLILRPLISGTICPFLTDRF